MLDRPQQSNTHYELHSRQELFKGHINQTLRKHSGIFGSDVNLPRLADVVWSNLKVDPISGNPTKDSPPVRSWFPQKFFLDDRRAAEESNEKSESITTEAGIWQYSMTFSDQINLAEKNPENKIQEAFNKVDKKNKLGLMLLFNQGNLDDSLKRGSEDIKFNEKHKSENMSTWLNYISSNKVLNESYKDWDVAINDKGEYMAADENRRKFDILTISQKDWEVEKGSYFKDIAENNLVAKVILIKDGEGKITEMKILNSHVYSDEIHGRRLLKSIFNELGIKNEDLQTPKDKVEILRSFVGNKKDEPTTIGDTLRKFTPFSENVKSYNGRDIEGHFTMTPEETELIKVTRNSFRDETKPPFSALVMAGHLAMGSDVGESPSGYICVNPGAERGAALQVALMRKISGLDFIKKLFSDDFHPDQAVKMGPSDRLLFKIIVKTNEKQRELYDEIQESGMLIKTEVDFARIGLGIAPTLDSMVSEASKFGFENFVPNAHKLISEGKIQHSSVDLKKAGFGNVVFTTALSNQQDDVLGGSDSLVSLRHRTRKKEYTCVKQNLHTKHKHNPHDDSATMISENIERELRLNHFNRLKNFRIFTAVSSFSIAYTNINTNPWTLPEEKIKATSELIELAQKVFHQIKYWEIEQKNDPVVESPSRIQRHLAGDD